MGLRILVFGDSITWGYYDKNGGWVEKLKNLYLDEELIHPFYNLGVSGNTTEDLVERLEFEVLQRKKKHDVIIIFQIGLNDSAITVEKNDFWVKKENFRENIKEIIGISKNLSKRFIFLGLTPVDEDMTQPWEGMATYKNSNIKEYNGILKSLCEENNVPFVRILEEWLTSDYKKLLEDGLHPNKDGHKKIFETVKNFITENKII
ncbi:MAG: hypothetical protein JW700_01805 [Candidatus Aenigmarchaeota archaeon]|nr:hypothetical protein [Candidatus Aenigmarchaeota archaeon]